MSVLKAAVVVAGTAALVGAGCYGLAEYLEVKDENDVLNNHITKLRAQMIAGAEKAAVMARMVMQGTSAPAHAVESAVIIAEDVVKNGLFPNSTVIEPVKGKKVVRLATALGKKVGEDSTASAPTDTEAQAREALKLGYITAMSAEFPANVDRDSFFKRHDDALNELVDMSLKHYDPSMSAQEYHDLLLKAQHVLSENSPQVADLFKEVRTLISLVPAAG